MSQETIKKAQQESAQLGKVLGDPKLIMALEELDNKSAPEILSILADMETYLEQAGVELPEGIQVKTAFNNAAPRSYMPLGLDAPVAKSNDSDSGGRSREISGSASICFHLLVLSGCIEVEIK